MYKNIVEGLEKRNQVTQNMTPEKNTLNKANLAFTFTEVNRHGKKQSSLTWVSPKKGKVI